MGIFWNEGMTIDEARKVVHDLLEAGNFKEGKDFGLDEDGDQHIWVESDDADQESRTVVVSIKENEDGAPPVVTLACLLAGLPEKDIVRLYRKLLELNYDGLAPQIRIGVHEQNVILLSAIHLEYLQENELEYLVAEMIDGAGKIGELLVSEYGALWPG